MKDVWAVLSVVSRSLTLTTNLLSTIVLQVTILSAIVASLDLIRTVSSTVTKLVACPATLGTTGEIVLGCLAHSAPDRARALVKFEPTAVRANLWAVVLFVLMGLAMAAIGVFWATAVAMSKPTASEALIGTVVDDVTWFVAVEADRSLSCR